MNCVDDEVRAALDKVVNYLYLREADHFQCILDGFDMSKFEDRPEDAALRENLEAEALKLGTKGNSHIFVSIVKVAQWLRSLND